MNEKKITILVVLIMLVIDSFAINSKFELYIKLPGIIHINTTIFDRFGFPDKDKS